MASDADTWTVPVPVTPAEFLAASDGLLFPPLPFLTPAVPAR